MCTIICHFSDHYFWSISYRYYTIWQYLNVLHVNTAIKADIREIMSLDINVEAGKVLPFINTFGFNYPGWFMMFII
jgi:hypothetical protein